MLTHPIKGPARLAGLPRPSWPPRPILIICSFCNRYGLPSLRPCSPQTDGKRPTDFEVKNDSQTTPASWRRVVSQRSNSWVVAGPGSSAQCPRSEAGTRNLVRGGRQRSRYGSSVRRDATALLRAQGRVPERAVRALRRRTYQCRPEGRQSPQNHDPGCLQFNN